jgi:hypothetical protein
MNREILSDEVTHQRVDQAVLAAGVRTDADVTVLLEAALGAAPVVALLRWRQPKLSLLMTTEPNPIEPLGVPEEEPPPHGVEPNPVEPLGRPDPTEPTGPPSIADPDPSDARLSGEPDCPG